MRALRLLIIIALMTVAVGVTGAAQSSEREQGEANAAITGRVMVNGKPAAGFVVMLERVDRNREKDFMAMFQREPLVKATTDNEGRYRLTGLRAARYKVKPFAPSHISEPEKNVTVGAGDTVENIDFSLMRGGVITGRVVKADGRPVIGETVSFAPAREEKNPATPAGGKDEEEEEMDEEADTISVTTIDGSMFGAGDFKTDDRGVYRIYGLPPGRYLLSVGGADGPFDSKPRYHTQTYHPGVTDKAKATVVEVTASGEVANVDIKLGLPSVAFRVSGRVIDAETGKPLPKTIILSGPAGEGGSMASVGATGLSNEKGEFRIEGVKPGRHEAFVSSVFDSQSEFYSDKTAFEVKNADVTGLVIKAHRGVSMSGIAVAEGTSDPATVARLSNVEMIAHSMPTAEQMPTYSRSKINPDGSFQFQGLRPGKTQISINTFMGEKKFHITRVERGGVEQKEFIEIAPGEQVNDLRIMLTYANATLRGQVRIEGGVLPKGTHLSVTAVRIDKTSMFKWAGSNNWAGSIGADVEANGQFEIEALLPGEYEITVRAEVGDGNKNAPQIPSVKQTVTVVANAETTMTIALDLSQKDKER
ncbi:MAG TPA: carboxypeptidase regulatory-like domain-containing protein [Blastocatellia bacterium]|nr:carboxypeptidase regulatory-like domain-containing protein [Blastocatellia bacterium]